MPYWQRIGISLNHPPGRAEADVAGIFALGSSGGPREQVSFTPQRPRDVLCKQLWSLMRSSIVSLRGPTSVAPLAARRPTAVLWGSITGSGLDGLAGWDHLRVIISAVYLLVRCLLRCLMALARGRCRRMPNSWSTICDEY